MHPELVKATRLHKASRLDEAEASYQRFLRKFPGSGTACYMLGILHGQQARFDTAAEMLGRSVEIDPDHVEARLAYGNALFELDRYGDALACYQELLKTRPDHYQALFGLGRCQRITGQPAAADSFRQAVRLKPDFAEALFNLAELLEQNGELDEAFELFNRCQKMRPDRPEIQCRLGATHERQGRLQDAEYCYRKAVELGPRYVEARWRLGDLLRAQGLMAAAVELYRQAIALDPRDIYAQTRYGHALLVSGSAEKLGLLKRLKTDHKYRDPTEAAQLARSLAEKYGYDVPEASRVLVELFTEFDPDELMTSDWWQERLDRFGSREAGHDRIARGVMSQVFSWSIPDRENLDLLADFVGQSRLNSLGAGSGYWEYLLNRHFGIPVAASDITLGHRFIDMTLADYQAAPLEETDTVFLAWIPAGEAAASTVLERMVPGQRLVLVGELPDSWLTPQTCATGGFYQDLMADFACEKTLPLVRFSYFRDSLSLLVKK